MSSNVTIPEITAVLPLLDDADPAVRRVALLKIADFADDDPQPFVMASRDSDAGVRLTAARALEGNAAPMALTALVALLRDEATEVAEAARDALSEVRDLSAGPVLLELLKQNKGEEGAAILAALRPLRLPDAKAPALILLEHASSAVRREAVGVLAYLRDVAVLPDLSRRLTRDGDATVRRAAAGALSFARTEAALPALSVALEDHDWQVREEAVVTLGKLACPASVPILLRGLDDTAWEVRLKAAQALGRLRAVAAIPTLIAALAHPVSNLRKEAAAALGAIGHSEAVSALEKAARNDPDVEVRKTATRALEAIRGDS
ncbi:hypothetical protein AGMMS50289_02730 [Betaproteobacteria bacterium]|nr:hypothetical protein AGMMS50289_02730 [Betaproteobacteria bacterium]